MSHYTVTVVLPRAPETPASIEEMLSEIVAPFDENTQVEKYKSRFNLPPLWADMTRRDLPWPYSYAREEAPKLDLGDHEATAKWFNDKWGEDESEGAYGADEEGLFQWSTYNPKSKWDWWALGGRWTGFYAMKEGSKGMLGQPGAFGNSPISGRFDVARKGDILSGPENRGSSVQTYGVIDANGEWNSPGEMHWFGMSTEDDSDQLKFDVWFKEFWDKLDDDTWLAVLDFHI
jgi:hypothetical protein